MGDINDHDLEGVGSCNLPADLATTMFVDAMSDHANAEVTNKPEQFDLESLKFVAKPMQSDITTLTSEPVMFSIASDVDDVASDTKSVVEVIVEGEKKKDEKKEEDDDEDKGNGSGKVFTDLRSALFLQAFWRLRRFRLQQHEHYSMERADAYAAKLNLVYSCMCHAVQRGVDEGFLAVPP